MSRSSGVARRSAVALLLYAAMTASALPSLPPPSPSPPEFQERPFGPRPAPTAPRPSVVRQNPERPWPRKLILPAAAGGGVVSAALLFFAVRAWRRSRVFDRQYVFRPREKVALRLGAERSGGLLASASFGGSASRTADRALKSKDA
jgi:hypothetical protein